MKELAKVYDPKKYEVDIYRRWEESGFFNPDVCAEKGVAKKDAPTYSIVLPPPNVTGTLHIGHATILALQDILIRYHRMRGDRTLWLPGTDHAAIATESKVEKLLIESGMAKPKETLGREKFLEKVAEFARESRATIIGQCRAIGASLDWSREVYTLDEKRNLAVRTVFKMMYDDGLIYRGHRLVNWDPVMRSNVADDEIEWKEEVGPFYYFHYGPFIIGTARPETKFGDKYVVMHPADERYSQYKHGDKLTVEWISGQITATIIKDEAVDPTFGTGVMTITPWHDATDFDIATRHSLDKEQIIDLDGLLLPIAGEFAGMPIATARPLIVEKLKAKGLLESVEENYIHRVATDYRGGAVIEPQIREQWFINVNKPFAMKDSKINGIKKGQQVTLKEVMRAVVQSQQIKIVPERFSAIYFHWIDNLRDWCISRQIWFGHRIPVWYCQGEDKKKFLQECKNPIVSIQKPQECPICGSKDLAQDPDTLDTWFSAGLWTFSTLGWPNYAQSAARGKAGAENDFANFHPTAVLETGYDIIFFWVARMILMTSYTIGDIPFHDVYLHGLVRDEQGRKMSKTLDNGIDPLDTIAKYGTDATRLSLVLGPAPGADVKLSEEKIAGFRNFANKLWNIARFMLLNIESPNVDVARPKPKTLADKWIMQRFDAVVSQWSLGIDRYAFSAVGELLRDFTWSELADWYLEIAKIEGEKDDILNYILNNLLKLWHPYMPFVTEAVWSEMYGQARPLIVEKFPEVLEAAANDDSDFCLIQNIVTGIRSVRADYHVMPKLRIDVTISAGARFELLIENKAVISGLARVGELEINAHSAKPDSSVGFAQNDVDVYVRLAGLVEVEREKSRITKEIAMLRPYVESLEQKLGNRDFVINAPETVVSAEKEKLASALEKFQKLKKQLEALS